MTKEEQIEIPLSKTKMILTLLGSLMFVGLGIWFLTNLLKSNHWTFGNPTVIFIAGIASVIFFGLVAIIIFRKFSDKKPGLIINRQGIIDNSSGVSAGLIPWTDIQEIKISLVMGQKLLLFIVKNPEDYLEKVTNPLKRNTIKMNYKICGSPISIASNALQTNFDDLYKLLIDKLNEYKS
ncbi:MAG TPA: STM3941 family protein [Bacteroidales bacterium]|nr:STM3941 family protein [Bacteroidales bacterium]HOR81855.1 STM3941 family protein [Bacteroidales bacterium]HPJ92248.1 STM3941 family protein [Bacteroidales bacterium]